MALHPDFPKSPHAILNPEIRWYPGEELIREKDIIIREAKKKSGA